MLTEVDPPQPRKLLPPERDVALAVRLAWGAHPKLRFWRANSGVGWFANGQPARKTDAGAYPVKFGVEGQADDTGIIDGGQRLEVEYKTENGKQSDAQKRFQAMIESRGGVYVLARSVADFDAAMAAIGIYR